ncbi:MAG: alpha/beta-type small acid-soluble spore protein [Clostridiales bacterium]|nr:alpha/beta-type small acid-soluble spore protein [Clostridiales bacterium]
MARKKALQVKPVKEKKLTENDIIKYEIACELGLEDKIAKNGWKSLTARESGKIGGLMAKRKRYTHE